MEPPTSYNPAQQRETMKPPQYPQPVAPSSSPTGTVYFQLLLLQKSVNLKKCVCIKLTLPV